jgi:excisionase family DNA binding protein
VKGKLAVEIRGFHSFWACAGSRFILQPKGETETIGSSWILRDPNCITNNWSDCMSGSSKRKSNADADNDRPDEVQRLDINGSPASSNGMLTEREVAELLGCSLSTVRRERRRKRITHHRYSRKRIRYWPEDVQAYQQLGRESAIDAPLQPSNGPRAVSGGERSRNIASDLLAAQAILNKRKAK